MLGNLLMRPMHCGFSLFTIQSLLNSLHFGFPLNCITLTLKRIISAIILKSVKKNSFFHESESRVLSYQHASMQKTS